MCLFFQVHDDSHRGLYILVQCNGNISVSAADRRGACRGYHTL